jgi:hypothetical protein
MNDENMNFEPLNLSCSEAVALKSIKSLLRLSATELRILIQQKDGPQDWMILPCRMISEVDVD